MRDLMIAFVVLGLFSLSEGLALHNIKLAERIPSEPKDGNDFNQEINQHSRFAAKLNQDDNSVAQDYSEEYFEESEQNVNDALLRLQDYSPQLERAVFLNGKVIKTISEIKPTESKDAKGYTSDNMDNITDLREKTYHSNSSEQGKPHKKTREEFLKMLLYRSQDLIENGACAYKSFEKLARCLVTSYPSIYSLMNSDNTESGHHEEPSFVEEARSDRYHGLQEEDNELGVVQVPGHVSCLIDAIKEYELCCYVATHDESDESSSHMHGLNLRIGSDYY